MNEIIMYVTLTIVIGFSIYFVKKVKDFTLIH
jgi:hypothetical protein